METELSTFLVSYTEKFPGNNSRLALLQERMVSTQNQLFQLMNDISYEIKKKFDLLTSTKEDLEKEIQIYNDNLKNLPKKEFELSKLSRSVKIKEEIYLIFLKELESARILKVTEKWMTGGVEIIDPASPPVYPLRRKKALIVVLGFIMSVIFSISTALFIEYKDQSLKTERDIEQYLDLPVLGVVTLCPTKHKKNFLGFGK